MSKIEKDMITLHGLMADMPAEEHKSEVWVADKPADEAGPKVESIPFLWVGEVNDGSPAQEAGLQVGDAVIAYDRVDHSTSEAMPEIARITKQKEGYPITVKVVRKGSSEPIELSLTPKQWSGWGLLGCFLSKNVVDS